MVSMAENEKNRQTPEGFLLEPSKLRDTKDKKKSRPTSEGNCTANCHHFQSRLYISTSGSEHCVS